MATICVIGIVCRKVERRGSDCLIRVAKLRRGGRCYLLMIKQIPKKSLDHRYTTVEQ